MLTTDETCSCFNVASCACMYVQEGFRFLKLPAINNCLTIGLNSYALAFKYYKWREKGRAPF